ncbi:MAG: DUF167 domain-containing protein [Chloroflexi bacterium]|nr:DUF167 domain-containing protein [Chloroflexota bacterium]
MRAKETATISVRVQPNARRNGIARFVGSAGSPQAEGVWHIKVTAPAVEGKANKALIGFLGEVLRVNKTSFSVIRGAKGRQKVIAIAGLTQAQVTERLKSGLG